MKRIIIAALLLSFCSIGICRDGPEPGQGFIDVPGGPVWYKVTGSGPGNVLMTTLVIPVPAGNEGVSAICTRIEQGGRTRYLYVPEPLEVTSAVPPPSIVAGSFRVEDGLVTFTILGSPGQTVIVEASANLIDWQTIATDTLKGTSWIFSDPDSPTFARRFYRVSAE